MGKLKKKFFIPVNVLSRVFRGKSLFYFKKVYDANLYYYKVKVAEGIGNLDTPKEYIWHISLIIQALTSNSNEEIEEIVNTLDSTDANSLFDELIMKYNSKNLHK